MTKLERLRTAAAIPAAFRGTGRVAKVPRADSGTRRRHARVQFDRLESGEAAAQARDRRQVRLLRVADRHGRAWRRRALPAEKQILVARLLLRQLPVCLPDLQSGAQGRRVSCIMRRRACGPGPRCQTPPTPAALAALAETLTPDALDLTAGHALADFLVAAEKEKAGLVNPYFTDPDPLFKWVANDVAEDRRARARRRTRSLRSARSPAPKRPTASTAKS